MLGDKTAKAFEALKVRTVGDLMLHLPRRYFSGTELSDLSQPARGEEVAVLAEVRHASVQRQGQGRGGPARRLQATITDGRGNLNLVFFGAAHLVELLAGPAPDRGRAGSSPARCGEFNGTLQLAHPDFVILDEDGTIVGGAQRNADLAEVSEAPADRSLPGDRQAADLDDRQLRRAGAGQPGRDGRPAAGVGPARGRCDRPPTAWRSVHQPRRRAEVERRSWPGCSSTRRSACS